MERTRKIFMLIIGGVLALLAILIIIIPPSPPPPPPPTETPTDGPKEEPTGDGAVIISFWTNDTKADWVNAVTEVFNQQRHQTASGKDVWVEVEQLSSGDIFPKIQACEIQPTAWSPGETSWVNDANAIWQDLHGRPLNSSPCPSTVYTLIGIGMWQPMAEAMGWPDTPIGWADIIELAADPEGWARYGHPEWGAFKFGHTHPDSSNTGFLALTGLAYAALQSTDGLTPERAKSAAVVDAYRDLEQHTYHYGISTRSLFEAMGERGPAYLHAATNSEIGVMANDFFEKDILRFPFVFIAPKEGAFWSDNPFCIIDAEWVTGEQREAAEIYRDFLLGPEAQAMAIQEWLRPVDNSSLPEQLREEWQYTDIMLTTEDVPPLASVSGETKQALSDVFHQVKKRATVILVMDTSTSMVDDRKLEAAVEAAMSFLEEYRRDQDDEIGVALFNDEVIWLQQAARVGDVAESLEVTLEGLYAEGNTALYDAVCEAAEAINRRKSQAEADGEQRLYGIVLLSDGQDTNSERSQSDLFACLPTGETAESPKIFTIAYGEDADTTLLERIANRTNGEAYEADPGNIREILLEILYEQ